MVSGLEYLLTWDLEDLEKDLNQVWSIKVMEVLLSEVSLVSCLHPRNYHALSSFSCVFYQAAECAV